jgi:hypothetical protein
VSVTRGVRAAIRVAKGLDLLVDKPLLIQETNSTVVWLRPHSIIAKVGTHAESAEFLTREHEVASILTAAGAPIAPPWPDTPPVRDPQTSFVVTLWCRLDHDPNAEVRASMVGYTLSQVQRALCTTWCWVQARFPEMQVRGEHHLDLVRSRWHSS